MLKRILKDTSGAASMPLFTAIFVMIVLSLTVAATTFVASYITYNRLITEVEQNLNDAAAKAEKAYLFLSETDQNTYSVDEATLQQMKEAFSEEFYRNLETETKDWSITEMDLQMYQSTEDTFAVLHRFTCHITIKVSLFNKNVGVINKDVALNGRHQFADIVAGKDGDSSDGTSVNTGEETTAESNSGSQLEEFTDAQRDDGTPEQSSSEFVSREYTTSPTS